MATILRTPLRSHAQPKWQGTPDVYQRSIALLGIVHPTPKVVQQCDSAPSVKRLGSDVFIRSLALTSVVSSTLPPGRQWFDSAPYRSQVLVGLLQQGPMLDNGPDPQIRQQFDSAPWVIPRLSVVPPLNLLTTTLAVTAPYNLPLLASRQFESAPQVRKPVYHDVYQNPVLKYPIPNVVQQIASAPILKYHVRAEYFPNTVVTGINPNAKVQQMVQSAPPPKSPVYVDYYPNYLPIRSIGPINLPLSASRQVGNLPQLKYSVTVKYEYQPHVLYDTGSAYAEDTHVVVPYLIGSTAAHATAQLASVHLLVATVGITGTVTAQDVAAFSLVARGTTVTITLGGATNNPPRGGRGSGGLPNYTLPN